MMELALTSRWHQGNPYNDHCPSLTASERTLVGCQGTAFAQIMYYWKWPDTGTGSKTVHYDYRFRLDWDSEPLTTNPVPNQFPVTWRDRLNWTSTDGGKLWMSGYWDQSIYSSARNLNIENDDYLTALASLYYRLTPAYKETTANFGAATYDWSVLQDIHEDPWDPCDNEVAELCHHSAIANECYFGVDATSSDWWSVPGPDGGPAKYLRYDGDSKYTNPRDVNMMVEEIQWLRPFGMGGGPPGHAWVIFGYNKGTTPWQFKMNMGWGGPSEWYTLDTTIPPKPPIPPTNHLTHIAPAGVVRFVGGGISGDGSPDNPHQDIEEAIQQAPDGATLIFKAGTDNLFTAETLTISKPLTLIGKNITIQ